MYYIYIYTHIKRIKRLCFINVIKIKKNFKTDSYPTEEIKLFEEVKGKKKKKFIKVSLLDAKRKSFIG